MYYDNAAAKGHMSWALASYPSIDQLLDALADGVPPPSVRYVKHPGEPFNVPALTFDGLPLYRGYTRDQAIDKESRQEATTAALRAAQEEQRRQDLQLQIDNAAAWNERHWSGAS